MCSNYMCRDGKVPVNHGEALAPCAECHKQPEHQPDIHKNCNCCGRLVHASKWVPKNDSGYRPVCFGCAD